MTTSSDALEPTRLHPILFVTSLVALLAAIIGALFVGPADLSPLSIVRELANRIPFVTVHSGLSPLDASILWQFRLPRIVLSGLVGAMLSLAGTAYQGVFQNALADPYLLGVAPGAGLGATIAIVAMSNSSGLGFDPVPLAAFIGAILAVIATYSLGRSGARVRNTSSLILAGVAVGAFFTAIQTYEQQ